MMAPEAPVAPRGPGHHVGPYGRQPLYWLLRERGITQVSLSPVVARSTSYVNGVLNGLWAPQLAFVDAIARLLGLPKEALFTEELLTAAAHHGGPRLAPLGQVRRARPGRFGRQPAYWVLRERRLPQGELCRATGQSSGYVSQVLNGSRVPTSSFLNAVSGFLGLDPAELFTNELIEASRNRDPGLVGPPPSERVGPHGRQPAYWMLRQRGITQDGLSAALGCSLGHVSKVLNGFLLPDQRFVDAVIDALQIDATDLFTRDVLEALRDSP